MDGGIARDQFLGDGEAVGVAEDEVDDGAGRTGGGGHGRQGLQVRRGTIGHGALIAGVVPYAVKVTRDHRLIVEHQNTDASCVENHSGGTPNAPGSGR